MALKPVRPAYTEHLETRSLGGKERCYPVLRRVQCVGDQTCVLHFSGMEAAATARKMKSS